MTALTDNCPACLTPDRSVPVEPHLVYEDGDSTVALYRCGCGHEWPTSRLTAAMAEPDAADPAA
jgi:hypothetical protein